MELKSFVISFLYENYYFNPEESFGYSKFYDYAIFNSTYDKDLSITITLVQNTVISDDNLLYGFLSPKIYSFYIIKEVNFNEIKRKNNLSDLSLSISYQLDSFEIIYNRSYEKLDSILANSFSTASIIKVFFLFF